MHSFVVPQIYVSSPLLQFHVGWHVPAEHVLLVGLLVEGILGDETVHVAELQVGGMVGSLK